MHFFISNSNKCLVFINKFGYYYFETFVHVNIFCNGGKIFLLRVLILRRYVPVLSHTAFPNWTEILLYATTFSYSLIAKITGLEAI